MQIIERIHHAIQTSTQALEERMSRARIQRAIRFSLWKNARARGLSIKEARTQDQAATESEDDWRLRMPGDQSRKG